jgi:hypothetical protein
MAAPAVATPPLTASPGDRRLLKRPRHGQRAQARSTGELARKEACSHLTASFGVDNSVLATASTAATS